MPLFFASPRNHAAEAVLLAPARVEMAQGVPDACQPAPRSSKHEPLDTAGRLRRRQLRLQSATEKRLGQRAVLRHGLVDGCSPSDARHVELDRPAMERVREAQWRARHRQHLGALCVAAAYTRHAQRERAAALLHRGPRGARAQPPRPACERADSAVVSFATSGPHDTRADGQRLLTSAHACE